MKETREKEIIVKHGTVKRLSEDTGYSETTVRHALRGYDWVGKDKRILIRKRAITEYGGAYAR